MNENENVDQPEFTDNVETQTEQNVEVDNQVEPAVEVQKPFLKVKYNKEEKELSAEQAIEYAQKGLNYDHVKDELESLKGSKSLKLIEDLASRSKMTTDEYVEYVERQQEEERISEMAKKQGIEDPEFAKRFYELEQKANKFDEYQKENETKKQAETRQTQEYNEFFDFYKEKYGKDVVVSEIPKEVMDLATKKPIKDAFIEYEYNRFLKGQAVEKKNEENAQTTTGSIAGNGTNTEIQFTPEMIENMSPKEMNKHWNNPLFRKIAGLDKKRAN